MDVTTSRAARQTARPHNRRVVAHPGYPSAVRRLGLLAVLLVLFCAPSGLAADSPRITRPEIERALDKIDRPDGTHKTLGCDRLKPAKVWCKVRFDNIQGPITGTDPTWYKDRLRFRCSRHNRLRIESHDFMPMIQDKRPCRT